MGYYSRRWAAFFMLLILSLFASSGCGGAGTGLKYAPGSIPEVTAGTPNASGTVTAPEVPANTRPTNVVMAILFTPGILTLADAEVGVEAVQRQLDRDFSPIYGIHVMLVITDTPAATNELLYLGDQNSIVPQQNNHQVIDGKPTAMVWVSAQDVASDKSDEHYWTQGLSHEVLEMAADPYPPAWPEVCNPYEPMGYLIETAPGTGNRYFVCDFELPAGSSAPDILSLAGWQP